MVVGSSPALFQASCVVLLYVVVALPFSASFGVIVHACAFVFTELR